MAGIPAAHFLHPKHELKLRTDYHLPHNCDLCGEKLTGSGYSCPRRLCNFHLHEECARYPATLRSFFAHPWHRLIIARTEGQRDCDLCGEDVPAGVFLYSCAPYGFDVHPPCSRLPQTTRSELVHPEHDLSLTTMPNAGAPCAACPEPCGVWVYRCGQCDVDLHIECLDDGAIGKNEEEGEGPSSLLGQVMGGVEVWNNAVELTNTVAEIKEAATDLFS